MERFPSTEAESPSSSVPKDVSRLTCFHVLQTLLSWAQYSYPRPTLQAPPMDHPSVGDLFLSLNTSLQMWSCSPARP